MPDFVAEEKNAPNTEAKPGSKVPEADPDHMTTAASMNVAVALMPWTLRSLADSQEPVEGHQRLCTR